MSLTKDYASLKSAIEIVDASGLLAHPNDNLIFDNGYAKKVRGLSYTDYWNFHKKNFYYHLMLTDNSLLLFEDTSYRFIMSPISIPSEEEYIYGELGEVWDVFTEEEKHIYKSSSSFSSEYESFIETTSYYKSPTPVRLDKHPHQYNKYDHPAHHLHIGYENESRMPVKRVLNVYAFTTFIISTFYPKNWLKLINSSFFNAETIRKTKLDLDTINRIHTDKWCMDNEETRLYLF